MRTETAVHDEGGEREQRLGELRRERETTLALALGAQTLAYGALYILPAASTAAWWAALLLLIPFAAMRGLAAAVRRTAPPDAGRVWTYRAAALGMAALFWSNMAVCLLTLTELTHVFFFPRSRPFFIALSAALALGLGLPRSDTAVPNAVRFLCWFLLAAFAFCALTVVPSGEAGYLFPLAGHGAGHTLRCALRGAGGVWMAGALAVIEPREKAGRSLRPALPGAATLALVSLLMLACAWVLPGTRLNFDRGYALRLQLLTEMSPNTLSWSLMLLAEMLLFLVGFTACADMMRTCLRCAFDAKRAPALPFALACVPLAARGMSASERALTALLPWRYPAAAALTLLCLCGNLWYKRKGKKA